MVIASFIMSLLALLGVAFLLFKKQPIQEEKVEEVKQNAREKMINEWLYGG